MLIGLLIGALVGAVLLAARGGALPQTGRSAMTTTQDETFKVTLAEFTAEKDAAKKAALKAKLDAEVARRKAAEAAAPKPLYPVGLEARFGKRRAVITGAAVVNGVPTYTISLEAGEFLGLGDGVYTRTEAELRATLAGEVGQMLADGQAFPRGVAVYRGGQGGAIQAVTKDDAKGGWVYTITGWPRPVTQAELMAVLRK